MHTTPQRWTDMDPDEFDRACQNPLNAGPNDVVRVTFFDHCQNAADDRLLLCTVYGKIHRITDEKLVIDVWHPCCDTGEPRDVNDNTENFVLVRAAIIGITKLAETPTPTRTLETPNASR